MNAVYTFWEPIELGKEKGSGSEVDLLELQKIAFSIPGDTTIEKLETIGSDIYDKLFPDLLKNYIKDGTIKTILIESSRFPVPFELMHDGRSFLATKIEFYRKPIIDMQKKWDVPDEIKEQQFHVAFFTNPNKDLPNAEAEVQQIINYFDTQKDLEPKTQNYSRDDANYKSLRNVFRSKRLDIFHYSGHSDLEQDNITFRLSDDKYPVSDILLKYPAFFFLNSCESSKAVEQKREFIGPVTLNLPLEIMKIGAKACVATLWPIRDKPAAEFAIIFYEQLLNGESFGSAMRIAKNKLSKKSNPNDITWMSFVLYGDPEDSILEYFKKVDEVDDYLKKIKSLTSNIGDFIIDNFDKIPVTIQSQILLKLSDMDEHLSSVAKFIRDSYKSYQLPEDLRNKLLIKISKKPFVASYILEYLRYNFDKLPNDVGNQLLINLSEPNLLISGDVRILCDIIGKNFNNLLQNVQNILFKLSESKDTAIAVAWSVTNHFNNIPKDIRNELLLKLSESVYNESDSGLLGKVAWKFWLLKEPEKTVRFGQKAVELNKKNYWAWDALGCGFYGLGKIKESYEAFQKALEGLFEKNLTQEIYLKVKKKYEKNQE